MRDKDKPDQNIENQSLPKNEEIIDIKDADEGSSEDDDYIIIELTEPVKDDKVVEITDLVEEEDVIELADITDESSSGDADMIDPVDFLNDFDDNLSDCIKFDDIKEADDKGEIDSDPVDLLEMDMDSENDVLDEFSFMDKEKECIQTVSDTPLQEDIGEKVFKPDEIVVSIKQVDDALERVLKKMLSEKIEELLCEKIEKAVTHEVDKLKDALLRYTLDAKKPQHE